VSDKTYTRFRSKRNRSSHRARFSTAALALMAAVAPHSALAAEIETLVLTPPPALAEPEAVPKAVVVLQGLDKVTARISTIEAPIDQAVRFGTLEITARFCRKRPPEEPPEITVFLEIRDIKRDQPAAELFVGWMFASSPALSALEHPVYDVWVIDCRISAPPSPSGSE
jgi:hypothetical protein